MPGISVDNYDTVLYFEDTGAPPGSTDYTTIVLIHGSIFHSGNYCFSLWRYAYSLSDIS